MHGVSLALLTRGDLQRARLFPSNPSFEPHGAARSIHRISDEVRAAWLNFDVGQRQKGCRNGGFSCCVERPSFTAMSFSFSPWCLASERLVVAAESSSVLCWRRAFSVTLWGFGQRDTPIHNPMFLQIFLLFPHLASVACRSVSCVARGAGFRVRMRGTRACPVSYTEVASFIPEFRGFPALSPILIVLAQPVSPADARLGPCVSCHASGARRLLQALGGAGKAVGMGAFRAVLTRHHRPQHCQRCWP